MFTLQGSTIACIYRSIPGNRPPQGTKCPGSHFHEMNGERPLPGKCPGTLSTVRNGKRPAHVTIFDQFFTSFFGPSKIKSPRISFPSKVSVPYSIASAACYGARYMECVLVSCPDYMHAHLLQHGPHPLQFLHTVSIQYTW